MIFKLSLVAAMVERKCVRGINNAERIING